VGRARGLGCGYLIVAGINKLREVGAIRAGGF